MIDDATQGRETVTIGGLKRFVTSKQLSDEVPLVIGGFDFDDRTEYSGIADHISCDDSNSIGMRLVIAAVDPGLASIVDDDEMGRSPVQDVDHEIIDGWITRLVADRSGPRIDQSTADEIVTERLACALTYGYAPDVALSKESLHEVADRVQELAGEIGVELRQTFGNMNMVSNWDARRDCVISTDLLGATLSSFAMASQYRIAPTRTVDADDIALNWITELSLFLVDDGSSPAAGVQRKPGWVPIPSSYIRSTGLSCLDAARHVPQVHNMRRNLRTAGIRIAASSVPLS